VNIVPVGILLAVTLTVVPIPAIAGPRDDVVDVLVKCTDVTDKAARLDCYDQAAPQLRAAAHAPAASVAPSPPPVQTAEPVPQTAAPVSQEGGSFLGSLDPFSDGPQGPSAQQMAYQPIGAEILPVTIGVADYAVASDGSFSVTLDNGQVWRERNEHFDHPQFRSDAKNVVVIERGLIGGYNLYLKGAGKPYKVLREK
jgi:hypothetical protein